MVVTVRNKENIMVRFSTEPRILPVPTDRVFKMDA
jgi:hypothetical protein